MAKSAWADPAVPEYHERPCYGIRKAFDACLMEAGIRSPGLGLRVPLLDRQGRQRAQVDKTGGRELMWRGLGSPNTLRHTLHTKSEEHTSELQSPMRTSYAVFCLTKKNTTNINLLTNPTKFKQW